jgi:parallel beta-helix repeat protein
MVSQAANPTSTFNIWDGIYPGAPDFTVWGEGSTYYAKDMNGAIDFSGTNGSLVVNNALDSLSHTSLERILLIGDFVVDDTITLPSNIIFEVNGKLKLDDDVNKHLITNDSNVTGNSAIYIINSYFEGNRDNQAADYCCIKFENTHKVWILNNHFNDFGGGAIWIYESYDFWIEDNLLTTTGGITAGGNIAYNGFINNNRLYYTYSKYAANNHGILISGYDLTGAYTDAYAHDIIVSNNILDYVNTMGISVDWGSYKVTISNNRVSNAGGHGIEVSHGDLTLCRDVVISGNYVFNSTGIGIFAEMQVSTIIGNSVTSSGQDGIYVGESNAVTISGNSVTDSGWNGIVLSSTYFTSITGNTIKDNSKSASNSSDGILLKKRASGGIPPLQECVDVSITGNIVIGSDQRFGIRLEDATDYVQIVSNDLRNNVAGAYSDATTGVNIIYEHNQA